MTTVNTTVTVTLTPDDLAAIERVVAKIPLSTKHSVARAAMRHGLDRMGRDTKVALQQLVAHGPRRGRAQEAQQDGSVNQ